MTDTDTATAMLEIIKPAMIERSDISEITEMGLEDFNGTKRIRLLPAAEWQKFPWNHLAQFCQQYSRYLIPTVELIDWLKVKIDGRSVVELAAGMGDLGRHLGITMTDSCMQMRPEVMLHCLLMGNPITEPPRDVQRFDAIAALQRFKPRVAVAGFLTQKFQEGDTENRVGSSVYGTDEKDIIRRVESYIFIGNEQTHAKKRITEIPHETYKFPWIVTRAQAPEKNVIWVWNR